MGFGEMLKKHKICAVLTNFNNDAFERIKTVPFNRLK